MTTAPNRPASRRFWPNLAVAMMFGVLLFAVLWYAVFSAVTAALIAGGGAGVILVGASVSDFFDWLLEICANAIFAILAVLASILSIFN